MKFSIKIFIITTLLALTGCKTIPMPDYSNQPIAHYDEAKNSLQDVEKAIIRAALSLGWKAKKNKDGEIEAVLDIRKHHLKVMITYNTETLSVKYIESENLKYNGYKIHRQYANWINNLLRAINANVLAK